MECEDQIKAVINDIRKRKKKLAEKSSILREMVSQHGLSESIAETTLEGMVKSGSLFTKESYYIQDDLKKNGPNNKCVKSNGGSVVNNDGNNRDFVVQFEGDDASPPPCCNILEDKIENRAFNPLGQMAMAITELNKLLNQERDKREKLFQENLELKIEIESSRAVDHVAISKAIVSEVIKDNERIDKVETVDCLGNNGCSDLCSQQKDKQHEKERGEKQQENQPAKKKKKRKAKSKQGKMTRNDADTAQSAQETCHPSTPNGEEPSRSSATEHNINNRSDNRKINTEKHGNELNISHNKGATMQTGRNDCWKKNTVLIVGDSMLNNIDERTLSKRYTTKVRCFRGSTVSDLHDYIKPLLRKKPDKIILVIGTNDIQNEAVADVLKGIKSLMDMILNELPNCHVAVSEIIRRAGKSVATINGKINECNSGLKSMNVDILRQQNILPDHINHGGLHLNRSGDRQLAMNIIGKI